MFKNLKSQNSMRFLIITSLALICFIQLLNILNGYSAFWFDPARDFMLAVSNLKKISLIGSPTGIPSVFYGPYWIWSISLAMLVTKDPSLIIIILQVIPYLIIFPYIFFKFKRTFSLSVCLSLLWLFYLSSGNYIVQIWNINYAPLLFLITTYLITKLPKIRKYKEIIVNLFLLGLLNALLINFHFSFGFAITIASGLFILAEIRIQSLKETASFPQKITKLLFGILVYALGIIAIESPIILFEIRHNFLQTKAILNTITQAFLYNTAVVGQTGLKQTEIINQLLIVKPSHILGINQFMQYCVYFALAIFCIIFFAYKRQLPIKLPKILSLYLLTCTLTIAVVYTKSKNPIFDYHFSGLEIIILLTIGIIANTNKYLKKTLFLWVFVLVSLNTFSFVKNFNYIQYKGTPLWLKEAIVKSIYDDAQNTQFATFAYSPAILTYDYDYIFYWLGKAYYKNQPAQNNNTNLVYLIIPDTSKDIYYDFINYKTPNSKYVSKKIWVMVDGTTILKREQIN